MQEEAIQLGPYQTNAGVFTPAYDGPVPSVDTAVICLSAGMLHHVGPHRLHVLLARKLADHGISTLRFDFSGIGDSAVRPDGLPALQAHVLEINEAITELENRGFARFILFGICFGAVMAIKAARDNTKITGLVLVNTAVDPTESEANTQNAAQFYIKRSLWNLKAWRNFFTGRVKYRRLIKTLISATLARIGSKRRGESTPVENLKRSILPFKEQGTSILMVMSDRQAQFYKLYRSAIDSLQDTFFKTSVHYNADHVFATLSSQNDLIHEVCEWSKEIIKRNG